MGAGHYRAGNDASDPQCYGNCCANRGRAKRISPQAQVFSRVPASPPLPAVAARGSAAGLKWLSAEEGFLASVARIWGRKYRQQQGCASGPALDSSAPEVIPALCCLSFAAVAAWNIARRVETGSKYLPCLHLQGNLPIAVRCVTVARSNFIAAFGNLGIALGIPA